jgi:hypothetical protein
MSGSVLQARIISPCEWFLMEDREKLATAMYLRISNGVVGYVPPDSMDSGGLVSSVVSKFESWAGRIKVVRSI